MQSIYEVFHTVQDERKYCRFIKWESIFQSMSTAQAVRLIVIHHF